MKIRLCVLSHILIWVVCRSLLVLKIRSLVCPTNVPVKFDRTSRNYGLPKGMATLSGSKQRARGSKLLVSTWRSGSGSIQSRQRKAGLWMHADSHRKAGQQHRLSRCARTSPHRSSPAARQHRCPSRVRHLVSRHRLRVHRAVTHRAHPAAVPAAGRGHRSVVNATVS